MVEILLDSCLCNVYYSYSVLWHIAKYNLVHRMILVHKRPECVKAVCIFKTCKHSLTVRPTMLLRFIYANSWRMVIEFLTLYSAKLDGHEFEKR